MPNHSSYDDYIEPDEAVAIGQTVVDREGLHQLFIYKDEQENYWLGTFEEATHV